MIDRRRSSILIFRLGSIGDTVVALPCFHAIARAFPTHHRVLLTNARLSNRASSAESVLDGTELVDEVIYYPVGESRFRHALPMIHAIRQVAPETLIYLTDRSHAGPVYRDMMFFRAAGVRHIAGSPWHRRLREAAIDPATGEFEHEADRLARVLSRF